MPVQLNGSTSGSVTITAPAVAGTNTLTLPANTGTIVSTGSSAVVTQAMLASNVTSSGPAFSAYLDTNQTITSNTFTKVTLNNELFDTASAFDSTTNYRFQPAVAGYYMFSFAISAFSSTSPTRNLVTIRKNGTQYAYGSDSVVASGTATGPGTALISLNGSTDYVELYAYITATTAVVSSGSEFTYLSGFLARAA